MQNLISKLMTSTLTACALATVALTGCTPDAAAGPEHGADEARLASSYEFVTVTKPESLEKYFVFVKGRYDICVSGAHFKKRSVKPFPTLPTDQVLYRTTYISNGRSFYQRTIETVVDTRKMKPDTECIATVYKRASTQVIHNGKVLQSYAEADGREVVEDATAGLPQTPIEILIPRFDLPKKVNDIALKCGPAPIVAGQPNRKYEGCVVDPALGVFTDGSGGPLIAYIYFFEPVTGIDLTVEPVSLTVGQRIDPRVFSLPAAK